MSDNILREIIPLTNSDCFTIFSREKQNFDFPLHNHEEIELNFIHNAKGAKRIVGNHIGTIDEYELVLIGSNLPHVWETHQCNSKSITEVTVQFHRDFLSERFLNRNQMSIMKKMFELSGRGILFSHDTIRLVGPRLIKLNKQHGFDSVLELLSILHDLSTSRNMRTLSDSTFSQTVFAYSSRRIEKVMEYINTNFDKSISLAEVAKLANMTEVSFSRFFKQKTGSSFVDSLTEIRLGHASRKLIDTSESVSEVAYKCGFNNISYFNRIFKRKKGCTPKEFRENLSGYRVFV